MTFVDRVREIGAEADLRAIAISHGATLSDVIGRSKLRHITMARYECMRYFRRLGWSYKAIGALFGRDYTTVMQTINEEVRTRRSFAKKVWNSKQEER